VNLVNIKDLNNVSNSQIGKAIRQVRITLTHPNEEKIHKLFAVLCKDKNQIINIIRELYEMKINQPKRKQKEFLGILNPQLYFQSKGKIISRLQSDEVYHFSDSDYLEIVKETNKLDPEYFMTSIYPEMMSWKYHKFISTIDVKEEIKKIVEF